MKLSAAEAMRLVRSVPDPELPWVTLGELGVVGEVAAEAAAGNVRVWLTPTYLGCPATEVIRADVEAALLGAGWSAVRVELRLDPPWTPDRITAEGRAKLAAAGIAPPPGGRFEHGPGPVSVQIGPPPARVYCPNCGSADTTLLSAFGAAPCQELRRCASCAEPFPAIKAAP